MKTRLLRMVKVDVGPGRTGRLSSAASGDETATATTTISNYNSLSIAPPHPSLSDLTSPPTNGPGKPSSPGLTPSGTPRPSEEVPKSSSVTGTPSSGSPTPSNASPITSTQITPLTGTSTSPPRTTTSALSIVLLSVQLKATNATRPSPVKPRRRWPNVSLWARQDESLDTPDPVRSSGFVGNSTIQNPENCTEAEIYVQSAGRLQPVGGRILSVDPGVDYINLSDYPGGSISSLFMVVDGVLVWENAAFYEGAAGFCQVSNGTVCATFTASGGPPACVPVDLVVYTATESIASPPLLSTTPNSTPVTTDVSIPSSNASPGISTARPTTPDTPVASPAPTSPATATGGSRISSVTVPASSTTRPNTPSIPSIPDTPSTPLPSDSLGPSNAGTSVTASNSGPSSATGSVIEEPYVYTTTTTRYTGLTPVTSTLSPNGTDVTGTVLVNEPYAYTTTTSRYTGLAPTTTTLYPIGSGVTATVVIETPYPYTTVTSPYAGPVLSTTTQYPSGVDGTATVIVQIPYAYVTTPGSYVTSYEYNGTAASTITTIPFSGTAPGTIIIQAPTSTVTSYEYNGTAVSTTTVAQSGTVPGTIIIQTPQSTVTSYEYINPSTGGVAGTSTVPQSGTAPGTVIIRTSPSFVTTTQYTGSSLTTTTVVPSGTTPGTIIILTPPAYVTTTQYTGLSLTTTTIIQSGPEPGTVIIQTPAAYTTITQTYTGAIETTTTVAQSGPQPGTVIVLTPPGYVTTTQGYTGAVTTTQTVAPVGTTPGTVIVQTPLPTLSCDGFGYLLQVQTLYRVNVTTGTYVQVGTKIYPSYTGNLNAMGYSAAENFLYAITDTYGIPAKVDLIRIDAQGGSSKVSEVLPAITYNTGDVDENSQYWASDLGNGWVQVDLLPSSANFGKVVQSGTSILTLPINVRVFDWAYVPNTGNVLWTVAQRSTLVGTTTSFSSVLMSWDRTTRSWSEVAILGNIVGRNQWGALYASDDGAMYGSENNAGHIYKFAVTPPYTVTFASNFKTSSFNDGARCVK
ncbi:hypothetical protein DL768_003429 [Monosporascus sp. mg162]|nr:hypothetical protein DL768_003429 [Monosporascus sp. mg162]